MNVILKVQRDSLGYKMFEWLQGRHDLTWKPSKEIKRLYEESLSEIQTSKKE